MESPRSRSGNSPESICRCFFQGLEAPCREHSCGNSGITEDSSSCGAYELAAWPERHGYSKSTSYPDAMIAKKSRKRMNSPVSKLLAVTRSVLKRIVLISWPCCVSNPVRRTNARHPLSGVFSGAALSPSLCSIAVPPKIMFLLSDLTQSSSDNCLSLAGTCLSIGYCSSFQKKSCFAKLGSGFDWRL